MATTPGPLDLIHFVMIGVVTAIDATRLRFRVGELEIGVNEPQVLARVQVGMRVEAFGLERDGRRVASRVTVLGGTFS